MKKMSYLAIFALGVVPSLSLASEATRYKEKLAEIVPAHLGEKNMEDNQWYELYPLITQEVLHDAHIKSGEMVELFHGSGLELISRTEKSIKRIKTKKESTRANTAFRVNSDFMAFRVHVDPSHIDDVVNAVGEIS